MKIEIVSIGTELLVSDILDTNSAYISRCLREIEVTLTAKVTVGDQVEMIADSIQVALRRADAVILTGGLGSGSHDLTRDAIARVLGHNHLNLEIASGEFELIGHVDQYRQGIKAITENGIIIALPGNRKTLAYLLETEVLPFLREQTTAVSMVSNWLLLRTVGIMESSIKQELADIAVGSNHRITFDSFAGQTNIRIWAENVTKELVTRELFQLRSTVVDRLGDHIFGSEKDLLEQVVLNMLVENGQTLALAECYTDQTFSEAISQLPNYHPYVKLLAADDCDELAKKLEINRLEESLIVQWCREAAQSLLHMEKSDVSVMVFKHVTPGGIQILITLASPQGVSVTQRSFGGHPENIHQWALTLGLTHLRRWLITRHQ